MHELILGGQKSGKSRRAETLTQEWLAADAANSAILVATAQAWDVEMEQRIARHQQDRRERVPAMKTLEEPLQLAQVVAAHSQPKVLLVVDCLTLWLTNWLMPLDDGGASPADLLLRWQEQQQYFLIALQQAPGPVMMVSNEIGWGVIPLGRQVRQFADALGTLNQQIAQHCTKVTMVVAGQALRLKDE